MDPFPEHVERLRDAKGISQARLINDAATYKEKGLSPETIRNAVTGRRGVELPKAAVIESVAGILDVKPEVFAAYRIQRARERLDPEVVGLATATATADLLLSQPIASPADVATAAAQQPAGTLPASAPSRSRRGRKARAS